MNRIGLTLGALGVGGAIGTYVLGRSLRGDGDDSGITSPVHDFVRGLGGELHFARGAGIEAVNVVGHHVHLPWAPKGTVFEPHGEMEHSGAGMIDAIARVFGAVPKSYDPADTRASQPLLASTAITVDQAGPTTLSFKANTDANWQHSGEESVLAAVFVDGRYVSDMPLLGERKETYRVLLGDLPAGEHQVELRIAEGSPITDPGRTKISAIDATASSQPLVDRYAPILEGRDIGSVGGRPEMGYDDTPMVLTPVVTPQADGMTRIDYHILFSNEDGGTKTGDLMHKYGRITDYEPMYTVLVDKDGNRVRDSFQTSGHHWMGFDGKREGDRPVIRVGTDNNLFTSLTRDDGHRWTSAPGPARDTAVGARTVMNEHKWTWSVMGRELEREHKQAAVGRLDEAPVAGDPRDYLYVALAERGHLPNAPEHLRLRLKDGREIEIKQDLDKDEVTAVALPKDVKPTSIESIEGIASGAYVLDAQFEPHELDVRQPLPTLEPVQGEEPTPGDKPVHGDKPAEVFVPTAADLPDPDTAGLDEQLPELTPRPQVK